MKKNSIRETVVSIVSGMVSGGLFLILLFLLKWNFFIDVLLSAGMFTALFLVFKPRDKIGQVYTEGLPDGEELKKYLADAWEDFRKIETSKKRIKDPVMRREAEKLSETAGRMLGYMEEHPEKIRLARQFIDYYQDTASSLLQKYVALQDTRLNTGQVQRLQEDTLRAAGTLNKVFEQQYQKLLRNEMMDMDAEIRLLEQTAKMENYNE